MSVFPDCKFYFEGENCSHEDAPDPYHSLCIGEEEGGSWDDTIYHKAKADYL